MYEMSLKCDEMKEENKSLKIDLNRISNSTSASGNSTAINSTSTTAATTPISNCVGSRISSDSHEFQIKKLSLKNSTLQTQVNLLRTFNINQYFDSFYLLKKDDSCERGI